MTEEQICLLYKRGWSGPDIQDFFRMPVKDVYAILKKNNVSRRTTAEQVYAKASFGPPAFEIPKELSPEQEKLMIAALMLYAAEGAKTGTTVDFTNSSPIILKVFLRFLKEVCHINHLKLRLYLYCFSNQRPRLLIDYWSGYLDVNKFHFTKPYVRPFKENYKRVMEYGVLHIRFSDKRLLETILKLSGQMLEDLGRYPSGQRGLTVLNRSSAGKPTDELSGITVEP